MILYDIQHKQARISTAHAAKSLRWSVEYLMKYLIRATKVQLMQLNHYDVVLSI